MKTIHVNQIVEIVRQMCIDANCNLPNDMLKALENSRVVEENALGKEILNDICENAYLAKNEQIPICQDTGTAVEFVN